MQICVALAEATTAAVVARMAELQPWADLFEVRADHVRDLDLDAILRARSKPILFTCRSEAEGGRSSDPEACRKLLLRAVERGFDLVDVEARAGFEEVVAAKRGGGLVLSWHDNAGTPEDLDAVYDQMAAERPDVVKIACSARSIRDLGRLLALASRHAFDETPKLVAIAMGPLGVASRILGGRYGAPFGFASAAVGLGTAPGQLTARVLAEVYRVRSVTGATRVYGLLGRDVLRSLSPAIQNRAFAEKGIDAVYVPLQAESLEAFKDALPGLALSGWSVTRPYKGAILGHLDSVTPHAADSGSANTVIAQDGRLVGMSTDGDGVLIPLRKRLDPAGRRVAILGAGGAARAAAFALVRAGARVDILARRVEQAREAAAAIGATGGGLGEIGGVPYDVLVNATPVGSGALPGAQPVPASALRAGSVVFDMVYEPRETPLLAAARARGCVTIDGVEMLVAQAIGQFEAWSGVEAPTAAMAEAALGAIEAGRGSEAAVGTP